MQAEYVELVPSPAQCCSPSCGSCSGSSANGYQLWDQRITGYSPISQPVSGLGMGATALCMNGAFIVNGLLVIAGAIGIAGAVPGLDATRRRAVAESVPRGSIACSTRPTTAGSMY